MYYNVRKLSNMSFVYVLSGEFSDFNICRFVVEGI